MEVLRIDKDDLRALLEDRDIIVIDVRRDAAKTQAKIKGARLEDPDKVQSWAPAYPKDKTLVLYCS